MFAYEFLAGYRAGLTYTGLNDGYPEWLGTPEQHAEYGFLCDYFLENESFPKEPETYYSPANS
jgi:hypothetical protein